MIFIKNVLSLSSLALAGVLAFSGCFCEKNEEIDYNLFTGRFQEQEFSLLARVSIDGCSKKVTNIKVDYSSVGSVYLEESSKWSAGKDEFFDSLKGQTVDTILTITFDTENLTAQGIELVEGAEKFSINVLIAVQEALKDANATGWGYCKG